MLDKGLGALRLHTPATNVYECVLYLSKSVGGSVFMKRCILCVHLHCMSGRLWVHEQITKDVRWGNTFKRGDTDDNDHIVFVFYDELQYGIQKV